MQTLFSDIDYNLFIGQLGWTVRLTVRMAGEKNFICCQPLIDLHNFGKCIQVDFESER